jgi:hypothetical protein
MSIPHNRGNLRRAELCRQAEFLGTLWAAQQVRRAPQTSLLAWREGAKRERTRPVGDPAGGHGDGGIAQRSPPRTLADRDGSTASEAPGITARGSGFRFQLPRKKKLRQAVRQKIRSNCRRMPLPKS